ncbi:tetratricopeptide repeat protein [Arenimonas oryziterrae]|uniref:Sel1 repeat family protein n=1 Tax=Arenimonas oryziterrae DSM 21050 = YC6267 TaxID=1121015 RepID=A0A091BGT1_9GAMM|nr:SEL1-like repeat protein [Arenimonas oryziterrae]KFN43580.1 hypothetical protein N789_09910 [Arenimonas oryziterrae DSM 21050 = YC6267]
MSVLSRSVPALALLLALAPCAALAQAPANKPSAAAAFDPAVQWQRFLDTADSKDVIASYAVVPKVVGTDWKADAAACAANHAELETSLATVPVGAAIRYAAFRCAEAEGDEAAAERHLKIFSAIARHALASASDDPGAAPIRVVVGRDIDALVFAAGLEVRYEFLEPSLGRYLIVRLATWDPETKLERHLRFDFLDTMTRVTRDPSAAYPSYRKQLSDAFIAELAKTQVLMGLDIATARAAIALPKAEDKVLRLRPLAERGGIQSTATWFGICYQQPFPGCGEGLVDALLPQAEAHHAIPMVLLALAYSEGIGVAKNEASAMTLIDAAEQQWGGGRASVAYAGYFLGLKQRPFSPALQTRLDRATALGNPLPLVLTINRQFATTRDFKIVPEQAAILMTHAKAGEATATALVGLDLYNKDRSPGYVEWLRKASEVGSAPSQSVYGSLFYFGQGVPKDQAQALHWWREAAAGGNTESMISLGHQAWRNKEWMPAAEWFRSAAIYGSAEGAMALASLYETGEKALDGDPKRAVEIYRSVATNHDSAEARRNLARMYLAGKGVEKDVAQARQFLLVDAEKDDRYSQVLLADAYINGDFGQVDEKEGERWFQRGLDAGDVQVMDTYALRLYYKKGDAASKARALTLWREVVRKQPEYGNNLAWALCTSPEAAVYGPAEGKQVTDKLGDPADLSPSTIDTVAACHAASGQFDRAVTLQEQAIAGMLEAEPDNASIAQMRERLAGYRSKKPYRETDRP